MQEFENKELNLKGTIQGPAPVQAEGTVNGFPFYFRARHDQWTFSISEDPEIDPVDIQMDEQGRKHGFFAEGRVGGEWEYAASYLDDNSVRRIIERCASEYLQGK